MKTYNFKPYKIHKPYLSLVVDAKLCGHQIESVSFSSAINFVYQKKVMSY